VTVSGDEPRTLDPESSDTPWWVWLFAGLFVVIAATVAVIVANNDDDATTDYTATITTNLGEIVIDLDTEDAPVAAGHFADLARDGFYDGLTFHRVVPSFVIQGGDPNGDGSGGSGESVPGEVPPENAETGNYPIGSLAAAKGAADPPGTFDAQFFIVTGADATSLPAEYARFGMVTEGLDVAQQIEALAPAEGDGPPTETVTIEKIEISEN